MKEIQVLLSYFQGEDFFNDQLQSIINQEGNFNLNVLIRDDGSPTPLKINCSDIEKINSYRGINIGAANSFFDLLLNSDDNSDFFAFSDQDDYWEKDKLDVALNILGSSEKPSMYFGKTKIVDKYLTYISEDSFEKEVFTFGRSIIKNNCIGCTMVINKALRDILFNLNFFSIDNPRVLHDNLIYSICLGIGGNVFYDSNPHMLYRQHESNVVGNRNSFFCKILDNGILNKKRIRQNYAKTLITLCPDLLDDHSYLLLKHIVLYRNSLKSKLYLLFHDFFASKNFIERLNIFFLVLFNKF